MVTNRNPLLEVQASRTQLVSQMCNVKHHVGPVSLSTVFGTFLAERREPCAGRRVQCGSASPTAMLTRQVTISKLVHYQQQPNLNGQQRRRTATRRASALWQPRARRPLLLPRRRQTARTLMLTRAVTHQPLVLSHCGCTRFSQRSSARSGATSYAQSASRASATTSTTSLSSRVPFQRNTRSVRNVQSAVGKFDTMRMMAYRLCVLVDRCVQMRSSTRWAFSCAGSLIFSILLLMLLAKATRRRT